MTETARHDATLTRDSPFSYRCQACSRCCQGYNIKLDPFEVLVLARHLGMTTTQFMQRYVDPPAKLKHKEDNSCVFLNEKGCSVHSARPLACRLYPLGRRISSTGAESFYPLTPHPQTEGIYGTRGTVAQYLEQQGVDPFVDACDRYLALYCRLVAALGKAPQIGAAAAGLDEIW